MLDRFWIAEQDMTNIRSAGMARERCERGEIGGGLFCHAANRYAASGLDSWEKERFHSFLRSLLVC